MKREVQKEFFNLTKSKDFIPAVCIVLAFIATSYTLFPRSHAKTLSKTIASTNLPHTKQTPTPTQTNILASRIKTNKSNTIPSPLTLLSPTPIPVTSTPSPTGISSQTTKTPLTDQTLSVTPTEAVPTTTPSLVLPSQSQQTTQTAVSLTPTPTSNDTQTQNNNSLQQQITQVPQQLQTVGTNTVGDLTQAGAVSLLTNLQPVQ